MLEFELSIVRIGLGTADLRGENEMPIVALGAAACQRPRTRLASEDSDLGLNRAVFDESLKTRVYDRSRDSRTVPALEYVSTLPGNVPDTSFKNEAHVASPPWGERGSACVGTARAVETDAQHALVAPGLCQIESNRTPSDRQTPRSHKGPRVGDVRERAPLSF